MDMIPGLAEQLHKVKQFNDLALNDILTIIKAGDVLRFHKDEAIFREDEPCAGMFVLIQGEVHLLKSGPEGQVSILNALSPVIMFNEVAALDGGANPVTCVANTEVTTWRVHHQKFHDLMKQLPQIGFSLLNILTRRNRLLIAHCDDLSFRSVQARLSKHLIELSDQGTRVIDRTRFPNRLMAARVVTTPEAVSRTLKFLKVEAIISSPRARITILDFERLLTLAQIDL